MKKGLICFFALALAHLVWANAEPTVTVVSAGMRPETSLLDVVYRVDDPDDATVKVRALAFIDGVRSFSNVLRPETWAEGTETNQGDSIATGVEHTLTWAVGEDWDIDLGHVKFEILCRDDRGLLDIDWITIPAVTNENAELTISKNSPKDTEVLDALFWQYADFDSGLNLTNGTLSGAEASGGFFGIDLVKDTDIQISGTPYICKKMNLDHAVRADIALANDAMRGVFNETQCHRYVVRRPYDGFSVPFLKTWGSTVPESPFSGPINIVKVAGGQFHNMVIKGDGTIVAWGNNDEGECDVPAGLSDVIEISVGRQYSLALKSDGTVVAWGYNNVGQCDVPSGLADVVAIVAGSGHSLALKADGTVVAWGYNANGVTDVPADLADVIGIAAGNEHSMALKSDGTVVAWGRNHDGECDVPSGLTDVIAIAAGNYSHSMALKSNGTVVSWGKNDYGQCDVPAGLTNVIEIAAGSTLQMALKDDGTVAAWGSYSDVPDGLTNVVEIAAGCTSTQPKAIYMPILGSAE